MVCFNLDKLLICFGPIRYILEIFPRALEKNFYAGRKFNMSVRYSLIIV